MTIRKFSKCKLKPENSGGARAKIFTSCLLESRNVLNLMLRHFVCANEDQQYYNLTARQKLNPIFFQHWNTWNLNKTLFECGDSPVLVSLNQHKHVQANKKLIFVWLVQETQKTSCRDKSFVVFFRCFHVAELKIEHLFKHSLCADGPKNTKFAFSW